MFYVKLHNTRSVEVEEVSAKIPSSWYSAFDEEQFLSPSSIQSVQNVVFLEVGPALEIVTCRGHQLPNLCHFTSPRWSLSRYKPSGRLIIHDQFRSESIPGVTEREGQFPSSEKI